MSAPSAPGVIRTATGGLLLRLLGLLLLAGLWLVLSAARADAETDADLPQLPTEPLTAPVSGVVETVPAPLPDPLAPVLDQAADVVDGAADPVMQPAQKPVEQVVGTVNATTVRVADAVDRTTTSVEETTLAVVRQVDEPVRRVRDDPTHPTTPGAPAPPRAGDPRPASATTVEVAESPVGQGDSRSVEAAPRRTGGPVGDGVTRVSHALDETVPKTLVVPSHATTDTRRAPLAEPRPASPRPLPAPLHVPATIAAAAAAGSSGPLQQLLLVAVLGTAVLLVQGSSLRVAVPHRRPRTLTSEPGTSPD